MPQYNKSIENAMEILSLFTLANPRWGISEIAGKLNLSKTTSYNLTKTLEKIGLLSQDEESKKYMLGRKIASLGAIMVSNMELYKKSAGLAQALSSTHGLDSRLGVWDEDAVLVIYAGTTLHVPEVPSYQAGPRVAAYNTALGRAILAHMDKDAVSDYLDRIKLIKYTSKTKVRKSEILKELSETKSRGFSICNEEMVPGSASIAAPIFDRKNQIAGALSLVGTAEEVMGSKMKIFTSSLCAKAFQISQALGYGI
jgi:IclR family KDG regulon transcriptional repressor